MSARPVPIVALLFVCATAVAQLRFDGDLPRFDGRAVAISEPESDPDGFFPKGPASVCLEGLPQRQCYTAPEEFGRDPKVALVQLEKDMPALFFSAASGGVSGWMIHSALLRPGTGKDLQNLFMSDVSVSNQSQSAFWSDPSISDAQFFITADYVWGPDESHYSPHRYIISAYVQKRSSDLGGFYYYLEDRYMTARTYDREAGADILGSEKPEILTRLRRLKLEGGSRRLPQ
jgi:hypothetical protein